MPCVVLVKLAEEDVGARVTLGLLCLIRRADLESYLVLQCHDRKGLAVDSSGFALLGIHWVETEVVVPALFVG